MLLAACGGGSSASKAGTSATPPVVAVTDTISASPSDAPSATDSPSESPAAPSSAAPTQAATTAAPRATAAAPQAPAKPVVYSTKDWGSFNEPLYLTQAAGDDARTYVLQKSGQVILVKGTAKSTFLDVASLTTDDGERGLLGLVFSPDYTSSGLFYIDYTDTKGNTHVVEYRRSANPDVADPGSAREVLEQDQPYANHNGGQLLFDTTGRLIVAFGDGGDGGDPGNRAQDRSTWLGKLLRIDPRKQSNGAAYGIPADNPYVNQSGVKGEIWAYGLRNPWRSWVDAATGTWLVGDVGQDKVEEIDIVGSDAIRGANFGWSVYEGNTTYNSSRKTQGPGTLVQPAFAYQHSQENGASVTGGVKLAGPANTWIWGDFASGRVWTATQSGSALTNVTVAPFTVDQLASFGKDNAGTTYFISLGGVVKTLVVS